MNKKYENLETIFFKHKKVNNFSFDNRGFWMKQTSNGKTIIINAYKINSKLQTLNDVNIFILNENADFEKRISAKAAKFDKNKLSLSNAIITDS